MNRKRDTLAVVISAVLITFLFHKHAPGINLLIFEVLLFIWLIVNRQVKFKSLYPVTFGISLIVTVLATIITHSVFSYTMNFIVLIVFTGLLIFPESKSVLNVSALAVNNLIIAQSEFFRRISNSKLKGHKLGSYFRRGRIFIIPLIVIIIFIILYSRSNPKFDNLIVKLGNFIRDKLVFIFKDFDFWILLTFFIGLIISNFLLIRIANKHIIESDRNSNEDLVRKPKSGPHNFKFNSLKNEYKAGVFLLVILNVILLVFNIIDINWVWFNFEWEGQYLKQFVHEGTYLLILSILISIFLVLYFFRRNLNFYSKNRVLKILSYSWLIQNAILALSVAIRNIWYIKYFALAYKRIGVFIFLILTLYGLYTVVKKVSKRKSAFYLFKTNSFAILLVLVFCSLFNWDIIIARYNFKHSDKSFLHLDYMATLSDKALPWLDRPLYDLTVTNELQKEKFPFERKYMTPEEYNVIIENRKKEFRKKWESQSFLSWNLPEYLAYRKLFH